MAGELQRFVSSQIVGLAVLRFDMPMYVKYLLYCFAWNSYGAYRFENSQILQFTRECCNIQLRTPYAFLNFRISSFRDNLMTIICLECPFD